MEERVVELMRALRAAEAQVEQSQREAREAAGAVRAIKAQHAEREAALEGMLQARLVCPRPPRQLAALSPVTSPVTSRALARGRA